MITEEILLPNFSIDQSAIPTVRLKSVHYQNFKAFSDYLIDFSSSKSGEKCSDFSCFYGPNGAGKTTILDSIGTIFSRFDRYTEDRLVAHLGKSVRHTDGVQRGIYEDDADFLITAEICSSLGDYAIRLNKNGFIEDHPEEIKLLFSRLVYAARFDQELHKFQLERSEWDVFQELFESVTGFKTEEKSDVFSQSDDPAQAQLAEKYVFDFLVHKPDETIDHKDCSAGERKIIKSFSTLLNKEYEPQIILIDNVAMHVESGRHLELIKCMRQCFPNSQIFATTHSYDISKNFANRSQLYDLRLLRSSDFIKANPWRLYCSDEIRDGIKKLQAISCNNRSLCDDLEKEVEKGQRLFEKCFELSDHSKLLDDVKGFVRMVSQLVIDDLFQYYND